MHSRGFREPVEAAIGAAMKHELQATWPLIFEALTRTQASFLGSDTATVAYRLNSSVRAALLDTNNSTVSTAVTTVPTHPDLTVRASLAAATRGNMHAPSGHPDAHPVQDSAQLFEQQPELLLSSYSAALTAGSVVESGGCTDASTRLSHILLGLAKAPPNQVERVNRDWAPLAVTFISCKAHGAADVPSAAPDTNPFHPDNSDGSDDESDDDGRTPSSDPTLARNADTQAASNGSSAIVPTRAGGKDYRGRLKEWLALLSKLKAARDLHRGRELQALVMSQLLDVDPEVQKLVLRCMLTYKVSAVAPYMEHLMGYCDNRTLKATLARFPLQVGVADGIATDDRCVFMIMACAVCPCSSTDF